MCWFLLKVSEMWIIKNLTMLMFNMALHFKFNCNPKKFNHDNLNYHMHIENY